MLTMFNNERTRFSKVQEQSLKPWGLLDEARKVLESYSYDLSVRMAQEAHELFAKIVLLLLGQEPPKDHNLNNSLHSIANLLTRHGVSEERTARLALGSKTLATWRELALYGDEALGVTRVFGDSEAMLAVKYAEEMKQAFCTIQGKVLAELYTSLS